MELIFGTNRKITLILSKEEVIPDKEILNHEFFYNHDNREAIVQNIKHYIKKAIDLIAYHSPFNEVLENFHVATSVALSEKENTFLFFADSFIFDNKIYECLKEFFLTSELIKDNPKKYIQRMNGHTFYHLYDDDIAELSRSLDGNSNTEFSYNELAHKIQRDFADFMENQQRKHKEEKAIEEGNSKDNHLSNAKSIESDYYVVATAAALKEFLPVVNILAEAAESVVVKKENMYELVCHMVNPLKDTILLETEYLLERKSAHAIMGETIIKKDALNVIAKIYG